MGLILIILLVILLLGGFSGLGGGYGYGYGPLWNGRHRSYSHDRADRDSRRGRAVLTPVPRH